MKQLTVILLFGWIFLAYAADNVAIIVSGSGEKGSLDFASRYSFGDFQMGRTYNLFFDPVIRLAKSFEGREWDRTILYSGLIADCNSVCDSSVESSCPQKMRQQFWTRACMAQKIGIGQDEILHNTFENLLRVIETQVLEPEVAPKQLLISIITHGEKAGYKDSESHVIQMNTGGGKTEFVAMSDPRLRTALEMVRERGTKIGVLDSSCYGGGSIDVLADLACVATTQVGTSQAYGIGINTSLTKLLEQDFEFNLADVYEKTLLSDEVEMNHEGKVSSVDNFYNQPVISIVSNEELEVVEEIVAHFGERSDYSLFDFETIEALEYFFGEYSNYSRDNFELYNQAVEEFHNDQEQLDNYYKEDERVLVALDFNSYLLALKDSSYDFDKILEHLVAYFSYKTSDEKNLLSEGSTHYIIYRMDIDELAKEFAKNLNHGGDRYLISILKSGLVSLRADTKVSVSISKRRELNDRYKAEQDLRDKIIQDENLIFDLKVRINKNLSLLRLNYYLKQDRHNSLCSQFGFSHKSN